jgi:hypothetical protein
VAAQGAFVEDLDAGDRRAADGGLQAGADDLDLREFRH